MVGGSRRKEKTHLLRALSPSNVPITLSWSSIENSPPCRFRAVSLASDMSLLNVFVYIIGVLVSTFNFTGARRGGRRREGREEKREEGY